MVNVESMVKCTKCKSVWSRAQRLCMCTKCTMKVYGKVYHVFAKVYKVMYKCKSVVYKVYGL